MRASTSFQPEGINAGSLPSHDPEGFAGFVNDCSAEVAAAAAGSKLGYAAGHDGYDDGLVHGHDWASAK